MSICRLSLLFALSAAAAVAQDARPPEHLLRLAFATGKTEHFELHITRSTQMQQAGRKVEASLDLALTLAAKVVAVKDGKADIECTVQHVVVQMDGPTKAEYDSAAGGEVPAAARRAVETFGGNFHFAVDDRGRSSGFELPSRDTGGMVMVEHSALESCLRLALPELPEAPLPLGGSWNTTLLPAAGLLAGDKIQVANKLAALDASTATLEQQLQYDDSGKKPADAGTRQAQTFRASTVLDLATGLPERAELEQVIKLDSKAGGVATSVLTSTRWAWRRTEAPPRGK